MLFKLERGKDPFELNPELRAIEAFVGLTARQMIYVILVSDYKTPFRRLSPEDKKYYSAIEAGYKLERDGKRLDINGRNLVNGKVATVEAAIRFYRDKLQKDEDYETLLSVGTLIAQIRELNMKPDKTVAELDKAVTLTTKLDKLVETKKKIEELLDMREEEVVETSTGAGEQQVAQDPDTVDEAQLPTLAKLNAGII